MDIVYLAIGFVGGIVVGYSTVTLILKVLRRD